MPLLSASVSLITEAKYVSVITWPHHWPLLAFPYYPTSGVTLVYQIADDCGVGGQFPSFALEIRNRIIHSYFRLLFLYLKY